MTIHPKLRLSATTTATGISYSDIREMMIHFAKEREKPLLENTDTQLSISLMDGVMTFHAPDDDLTVTVTVSADQPDMLHMLKNVFLIFTERSAPETAARVRWDDGVESGGLPPNFRFITVQSVTRVGADFLRVQARSNELDSLGDSSIHFRLVLPPKGVDKVKWPHVGENGGSVWPTGDAALHRPVYTIRRIDHGAGLMEFDIFEHDGGRATEWARTAGKGDLVGLVGPAGSGVPDTREILMFADETAIPAAARILESLPDDTTGHIVMVAQNGKDCGYPLTLPPGVSAEWKSGDFRDALADHAIAMHDEKPDHYFWFAGEKAAVQKIRAAYRDKGGDPARSYIAAYWSAE